MTKEIIQKNDCESFSLSIKCPVQDVGRLSDIYSNTSLFPTVRGIDTVVYHKADAKTEVRKDTRSKDMEAVVRPAFYMVTFAQSHIP